MEVFILIFKSTVMAIVGILQIAMLARCVTSFLLGLESRIYDFLCMVTEPIIYPWRILFDKLGLSDDMILDVPFFVALIALSIAEAVLTVIG